MKERRKSIWRFPLAFIMSKGKVQPVYCWATIFLSLITWALVKKILAGVLSDLLISTLFGGVVGLITLYSYYRYKTRDQGPPPGGTIAP